MACQQLVAAGERVLGVQPKLAARVRSVAVAALCSPGVRIVVAEDHTTVMRLWAKRQRDLSGTRTQVTAAVRDRLTTIAGNQPVGGSVR